MDENLDVAGLGHYALRGCVVHKGDARHGGHYVTIAMRNDNWWRYDDGFVSLMTLEDVQLSGEVRRGAYILLYVRS